MFTKRKITIHDEKKSSKPYEEAEAIGYLNTEPLTPNAIQDIPLNQQN